jgi:hypothetical protein
MQSDDLGLARLLRSRIGVEFDGEVHLTEAEAQSVAAAIERLVARAEAAELSLLWAMDEIDVLSNRTCQFAYPQGMAYVGRRDQLDNYRKAVDVRRARQALKDAP